LDGEVKESFQNQWVKAKSAIEDDENLVASILTYLRSLTMIVAI